MGEFLDPQPLLRGHAQSQQDLEFRMPQSIMFPKVCVDGLVEGRERSQEATPRGAFNLGPAVHGPTSHLAEACAVTYIGAQSPT